MKKLFARLSHLSFCLLIGQQAHAWGASGHRVVAEIVDNNLHPSVRAQITSILGSETLEEASHWPDYVKDTSEWKHTKPYHYRSIDSGTYFDALKSSSAAEKKKGDMIRTLVKAEDVLLNASESKAHKKMALRFLLHMIADLHQPLHVGYYDDVGGNTIEMDWYGDNTNLHAVWDGGMIYAFTKKTPALNGPFNPQAYSQYLRKPTAAEIKQWQSSYIMTWFNEALAVRDSLYVNHDAANDVYYKKSLNLLHDKMLQAGHRTAGLLNNIFLNPKDFASERSALRQKIAGVLGKTKDDDIELEPRSKSRQDHSDFSEHSCPE